MSCSLVLALLAGCVHTAPKSASGTTGAGQTVPVPTRHTTHVFVGNCIFAADTQEFALALLGTVLPSLISNAFNRFGSALDAAGKEHTWQATASTNFETSKTTMPRCVQIVRGTFLARPDAKTPEQTNDGWAKGIPTYEKAAAQLVGAGMYLAERPDFFFEGVFRESTDPAVMAIAPILVDFNDVLGERAFRSEKKRSVSIMFAFHPPGKPATDATNPSTSLVLGELSPGSLIEFDYGCAARDKKKDVGASGTGEPSQPGGPPTAAAQPPVTAGAPPAQPPAQSPSSEEQAKKKLELLRRACADESLWFKLTRGDELAQLSLTTAVTEVQGKNEFLVFLSDVFKGSQQDLEKLAKVTLIDAEREKARLAAITADNEAAVAYDKAATGALIALEACSSDGTIAKAGDARVKQQTANLAAVKAGLSAPFAAMIPLNGTADEIAKACKSALTAFK